MYCLATPTIVSIFRGDPRLKPRLEKLAEIHLHFSITPNTLSALYGMAQQSKRKAEATKLVEDFAASVNLLDITPEVSKKYAALQQLKLKASSDDLWTAAACVAHGLIFVVREIEPWKRVPGLKIEKW